MSVSLARDDLIKKYAEEIKNDAYKTIAVLLSRTSTALAKIGQNCPGCLYFNEGTELCQLAKARPPAHVIAFGCEKHEDDPPF